MFNLEFLTKNQKVELPILEEKNIELWIKREDKIHKFVSGNKFRKLKYNLQEAKLQNKQTLLTFGGAYSNHIVATAVAGNITGFKTIGVIRGDELANDIEKVLKENATLKEASRNGMQFKFVSREVYRQKEDVAFIQKLEKEFESFYLVPEGGTNDLAIKGCEEILNKEDNEIDYICLPVGTGGTICGVINASIENKQTVLGFPALKGDFLLKEIKNKVKRNNWELQSNYHFGGYAKYNEELISFINQFKTQTGVLLDPIYTGKTMFGILDLIQKNYFKENSKILMIHTGGIQGIEGINSKLKRKKLELIVL